MVDQARELERLNGELFCKDQILAKLEDDNQSFIVQFEQLKDQLNRTLKFINNENHPVGLYQDSASLIDKVISIENYIRGRKQDLDCSNHSEHEALYVPKFNGKFTPKVSRNPDQETSFHTLKPLKDIYSNSANSRLYSRNEYPLIPPETRGFQANT
jgi:hypothetical protein